MTVEVVSGPPTSGFPYCMTSAEVPYATRYLVTGDEALDHVRVTLLLPGVADNKVGALPGLEAEQTGAEAGEVEAEVEVEVDVAADVGVGVDSGVGVGVGEGDGINQSVEPVYTVRAPLEIYTPTATL